MCVLMYVFSYSVSPAATNDRAEWRLLPTVVFQEFSNEERCNAAKSALEGSLSDAGAKLRSGLEDLKTIGKADPTQIIIAYHVECLPNDARSRCPYRYTPMTDVRRRTPTLWVHTPCLRAKPTCSAHQHPATSS
jgi:hypothetical protein